MRRGKPIDRPSRGKLTKHPAVAAWRQLRPAQVIPADIVILKETSKSRVYRLAGIGPGGSAVIAKRCGSATALVERAIYEEILPHLPISALRYFGCVEDPQGVYFWLFVEDAGEARYAPEIAEHRVAVARWLGRMHTSAVHLPAIDRLPDRGPAYYLDRMQAVCSAMRELTNPVLTADDRQVLVALLSQCELLTTKWSRVESLCDEMPRTLVHGDLLERNVRVRMGRNGVEVLVFDWEEAGMGVPAADLGQRLLRRFPNPDLTTYWSVVREAWPHLGLDGLHRLAEVGKILRCLVAIGWALAGLTYPEVEKPMAKLEVYRAELDSALKTVELER